MILPTLRVFGVTSCWGNSNWHLDYNLNGGMVKYITELLTYSLLVILVGYTEPGIAGSANPYQGTYVGTETLEGGSHVDAGDYPLTIYINAEGKIRIVDVDSRSASGQMEGNKFHVERLQAYQIFDGVVKDKAITGVTTENEYTGDGTFSLKMQEN